MGRMRTLARALAAAALLAPATGLGEDVAVGLPAPGFTLRTLNPDACGTGVVGLARWVGPDADDAQAKAVLISFFASWCAPCRKEMPYLQQLHEMYRERGLRVLSVTIDREDSGIEESKRIAAAAKVSYPIASDRFNLLARRYLGAESPLPSVFLVGKDGTIVRIEKGYDREASTFLLAEVQRALGLGSGRARPLRR